jgi:CheY-like chemotaxis protein
MSTTDFSMPPQHLTPMMPTARVLVIENNDALRYLFYQTLCRSGFGIMFGSTGAHVLQLTEAFQPDILLIDLDIPNVNALDLIRAIKTQPSGQHLIVIGLTERDRYYYHAAETLDYFLFKPVSVIKLIDLLRRISATSAVQVAS